MARRALWLLLVIVTLFIALATWLTTRTIGQVETIQRASDALEVRNFRVGTQLRSKIYQLSSVMLRYEVTGVDSFREQFANYRQDLESYLTEQKNLLREEEEIVLLGQIHNELDLYYTEVQGLFESNENERTSLERIERLKSQVDSVIELTYRLADSRRGEFRQLLADYRQSSRRLERYIFLAVGALLASAMAIAWLAYQAYMNPIRRELSEAKIIAHQKEELATVGALAGGIAHEIRNPITGIRARLFALAEMLDANSPAAKQAAIIDQEITRMERIVNDFLDFARPAEPNVECHDLRGLISELHEFHLPELSSHGIEFQLDMSEGDGEIHADVDVGQIRQVLTNLVRNADESFPPDAPGTVTLGLRAEGDQAVITVRDNGAGMPASVLKRVFEPFFSKRRGGTGLGLAVTGGIISKHRGTIIVESTVGTGTLFKIALPLSNNA